MYWTTGFYLVYFYFPSYVFSSYSVSRFTVIITAQDHIRHQLKRKKNRNQNSFYLIFKHFSINDMSDGSTLRSNVSVSFI